MARKTFISYKYSESRNLRDKIISALGDDGRYYNGETAESPNLTSQKVESIKENLKSMIYDTSVMIVIVSPNMKSSNWIDWEIQYSLREYKRNDKASKANGIVCVVQKITGSYDWLISNSSNSDGCSVRNIEESYLFEIIKKNRFNKIKEHSYACDDCGTFDQLDGSYISIIEEDRFLKDPSFFIENAYSKSNSSNYKLSKTV